MLSSVEPNMSVEIAGIQMKNPVMPCSGCFGFGEDYSRFMDLNALGAIVVKSVTLQETKGNKPPRICETPAGMINSIGWQNPGLEVFINEKMPFLRQFSTPVLVNLAGKTPYEYAELAKRLDGLPGLAGMELNISCPNVDEGGLAFGVIPKLAAEVTIAVRKNTTLPLIVKLSPNVTDITTVAKAVEEAGADAISLVNAFTAMAVDSKTRRPVLGKISGGLSGPAIKPIALYMTWRVAQTVKVPIIGMGGIAKAEDAIEFLLVGASAVGIGIGTFIDPDTIMHVISGIRQYLLDNKINDVRELVGALKTE